MCRTLFGEAAHDAEEVESSTAKESESTAGEGSKVAEILEAAAGKRE